MKIILILTSIFLSVFCQAATRLQFFIGDRNAMAILTPTDSFGNSDSDSSDLYQVMNVPEQDTMLGKGKSIMSPSRDFNLVCGEYKSQCQVILNASQNVVISSAQKHMRFAARGDMARILTNQFKLNSKGEAYFQTSDKIFLIKGFADEFIFEAISN